MSLVTATPPGARSTESVDNSIVLAVGPSAEFESNAVRLGFEISVEADLVENWLEIEAGVQGLWGGGGSDTSVDFLVKKPFTLGRRLSIMPGVGLQVSWAVQSGRRSTALGLEIAADLMWWVFSDRIGLGAEPTVGLSLGTWQPSFGITLGPIFGW